MQKQTDKKIKKDAGFIALMSVIIICVILVLITTTLSFTGFYGRYNILESELKERSSAATEGCIDAGLLIIANNTVHTATTTVILGPDQCQVGPLAGPVPYAGTQI